MSNIRSVLLYGSETWKTNNTIENKLRVFENSCLGKILKIKWTDKVSNKEVEERSGVRNIVKEIGRRKWKWIGHVMRMDNNRHPKVAMRWTPPGKRKRGRPKGNWRRSVESEMKDSGYSWGEIEKKAKERTEWRCLVAALYGPYHEED